MFKIETMTEGRKVTYAFLGEDDSRTEVPKADAWKFVRDNGYFNINFDMADPLQADLERRTAWCKDKPVKGAKKTKPAKEAKVEETEQVEATLETTEEAIKAAAEIAPDARVEETIDGGDGQSITIVH